MKFLILKKMNISLSVILFIAGFTHLIKPQIYLKAMPPYIPYHYELIIISGIFEVIFSAGLLFKASIKITSWLLAIFFIAILPSHIHVSLNGIEFFGITSKYLLWLRTLLQSVFIFWAIKCRNIQNN